MSGPLDREHFLAGFVAEADDHLRASSTNLLAVEQALRSGAPQARAVRELFRSLHTLKGLAAMVGVEPIVELAHRMEAILRAADRAGTGLLPSAVAALIQGVAAIEARVRAVADRRPVPAPPEALLATLAALEASPPVPVEAAIERIGLEPELRSKLGPAEVDQLVRGATGARRAARVDFVPSSARAEQGITITTVRERVSALGEIVKVLPRSRPQEGAGGGLFFTLLVLTDASDEKLAAAAWAEPAAVATIPIEAPPAAAEWLDDAEGSSAALRQGVIRVEVARLDDALEKLSALVVMCSRLARAAAELREAGADVRELHVVIAEMTRQLRDLRGSIMRARMVSVAELLDRVPLIVRGLSQSTGKEVRLEVDAARAELDKAVAERVFPAIVHLVRNAVDHAIEAPEERERKGKPRAGTIRVSCFEPSDGQLEIVVSDDGRGVDRETVARKAGRPVPRNDAELLALVTLPGLSTRDAADKTSGRGMGLDIVKRTVEALGGAMHLATVPGGGTRFTLRVPLSVSILDAFALSCGGQSFVVPMATVEEIVELEPGRVRESPSPAGAAAARLLERRGRVMPLFSLAALFALEGPRAPAQGAGGPAGDVGGAARERSRQKALIVRRGAEPFAFAVDRMLGQQEVVIRPLEDPLVKVRGVAGTTDLGDGRPTLVLDLVSLAGVPVTEEVRA